MVCPYRHGLCTVATVYGLPIHSVHICSMLGVYCVQSPYTVYVRIYSMLGVYCVQSPYTVYVRIYSMLGVYCVQSPYTVYVRIYSMLGVYYVRSLHTYVYTVQYVGCLLCTVSLYTLYVYAVCWVSTVYSLPIHTVRICSMLGVYCVQSPYTHCTYMQYVGCLLCTLSIHMLGHSLHDSYEEVTILCPPRPSCTCLHVVCYYVYCILCIVCYTEGWV